MPAIQIAQIKQGDSFWECRHGISIPFVAIDDAQRVTKGTAAGVALDAHNLATGAYLQLFEADAARGGAYALRLFTEPQA